MSVDGASTAAWSRFFIPWNNALPVPRNLSAAQFLPSFKSLCKVFFEQLRVQLFRIHLDTNTIRAELF